MSNLDSSKNSRFLYKNFFVTKMSETWKENIVFAVLLSLIQSSRSQIVQQYESSCPVQSCKVCKYKVRLGFLKARYEERISKDLFILLRILLYKLQYVYNVQFIHCKRRVSAWKQNEMNSWKGRFKHRHEHAKYCRKFLHANPCCLKNGWIHIYSS